MYLFVRDHASFEALARGLQPDEALAALWLAGRLEMPALQRAVAARLDKLNAGEARRALDGTQASEVALLARRRCGGYLRGDFTTQRASW